MSASKELVADDALAARRGRGRPRRTEVDERILEAAIDELCENGVAGFTFERVAAQAGVARTTVYRRWPTKVDLVVGAIGLLQVRSVVPDTGDLEADLIAGLDNMTRIFASPQGKAIGAVLTAGTQNDELTNAMHDKVLTPHRAAFRAVFERAVNAGEIELLLDIDETIAVLSGFAFVILFGGAISPRPGLSAGVVETMLRGLRTKRPEAGSR